MKSKNLLICVSIALLSLTFDAKAQTPLPTPSARITPVSVGGKVGEPIIVRADTVGEVAFAWPTDAGLKVNQEGGKFLVIVASKEGTYVISCAAFKEKVVEQVKVVVSDSPTPVPPPIPPDTRDTLAQLRADMNTGFATIDKRLTVLENRPTPTPIPIPVDSLTKAVQDAFNADGRPANAVSLLASLYKQSPAIVNDATLHKMSDVQKVMHNTALSLIGDQIPTVRQVIAADLITSLGKVDKDLDPATRILISAQFLRAQKALEAVK